MPSCPDTRTSLLNHVISAVRISNSCTWCLQQIAAMRARLLNLLYWTWLTLSQAVKSDIVSALHTPWTMKNVPPDFCTYIWQILTDFYARQQYRQVLLRARISYGNSVCLSVTTRYGFKARWDSDSGSPPYDSFLVSYEVIWCHWVKRFPSNEGVKEGYPLRNRYFATIGSSSVKTVADGRLAAYHNKHCWQGTNIDDLEPQK